ncbi:MAG: hypothetical protein JXO22_18035, partial [Phycisphaerae bacterium]|nr:hypothetical protein [Phycisphaerae bacterium]
MPDVMFQDMKRYVGFGDADAENLRALRAAIQPHLSALTDAFYHRITHHPGTRRLITGGESQLDRLHRSLAAWLNELFDGDYDNDYCRRRLRIGQAHVAIGMPQYYMVAAMEVVWQLLEERLRGVEIEDVGDKLRSLHKLLQLDTALMLESYKESYTTQIRAVERAAVRERLDEAEHLAHIGHLAASLAHEIKNPLAGISGAVQVIRDALSTEHPHRPILSEILRQISRLDGTVKDLLVYARPKPPRFRQCDLGQLLTRVLPILREQPEMQRVRFEYVNSQPLPAIQADEHQLDQLLTNLLLNAAQASPTDGLVRLVTTALEDGVRL